jgi:HD superfamily phosphodiesterase
MICTENESNPHSLDFYGKTMIACYLHDLGMTITTGVDHGVHSRNLAAEFLSELSMDLPGFTDMLDAIEKHDNKEYSSGPEEKNKILVILSAADDMDAYGHIGIYRYLEIYIERGVPPEKIADEIRKNAANRFRNLESQFGNYSALIEKHRKRYLILDDFFREFGSEAGFSH